MHSQPSLILLGVSWALVSGPVTPQEALPGELFATTPPQELRLG